MILIFTNKQDAHPTSVIEKLLEQGVSCFRLNTESLLTDYNFYWSYIRGHFHFSIKCLLNGYEIDDKTITAIWERRPESPTELPIKTSSKIDKHNLDEALGFLRELRYYLKDLPSIGSICNDRISSSKMLQLKLAHDIGFSIPDTVYANKKDSFSCLSFHKDLLVKSINSDGIWNDEEDLEYVFYSQKCKALDLSYAPDEAFSQTVSFIQNYIEKRYELRITVVGAKVFATKIDSQILKDHNGKVDWRQGYDNGLHLEEYVLPTTIAHKCVSFLQKMGLIFGCFDFIVTSQNQYVFLECNPNGQWLWVEIATGQSISTAIAEFFIAIEHQHGSK